MNEDAVQATVGPGPGGTGTTSVRSYRFFTSGVVAAAYPANPILFADPDGTNFVSNVIQLFNDGPGAFDIFFSFDGTNDHGQLKTTDEQPLNLTFRHEKRIWLRGTAGKAFRLAAW